MLGAYLFFKEEFPELKLGKSKFAELRSLFVSLESEKPHNVSQNPQKLSSVKEKSVELEPNSIKVEVQRKESASKTLLTFCNKTFD